VITPIDIQNILSVIKPWSEAATGNKSGCECKKDQVAPIDPNTKNTRNPIALTLFALSTDESWSCSTPLIPFDKAILLLTIMIAKAKNTTDKRPIKYVILLANFWL
jgi:hypothetical protein